MARVPAAERPRCTGERDENSPQALSGMSLPLAKFFASWFSGTNLNDERSLTVLSVSNLISVTFHERVLRAFESPSSLPYKNGRDKNSNAENSYSAYQALVEVVLGDRVHGGAVSLGALDVIGRERIAVLRRQLAAVERLVHLLGGDVLVHLGGGKGNRGEEGSYKTNPKSTPRDWKRATRRRQRAVLRDPLSNNNVAPRNLPATTHFERMAIYKTKWPRAG